jgi:hypothetical protein
LLLPGGAGRGVDSFAAVEEIGNRTNYGDGEVLGRNAVSGWVRRAGRG